MSRMKDNDKLIRVARQFGKKHEFFTSAMLYNYLLARKIIFRKTMTSKRIGIILSNSDKFHKIKKHSGAYYQNI